MTPNGVERLTIGGPAGSLEAMVDEGVAERAAAGQLAGHYYAIVCHPHPLFGGTMDNKVVTTSAKALHETGIPTLCFNFRGVGSSSGSFDAGAGETADAHAVAQCGAARWPGRRLVIAGFSFGAYVALRVAQEIEAAALITIAPPVSRFEFSGLSVPACPWLVVQGDADELVDPHAVTAWAKGLRPQPQLALMPGVGHFFHGRLPELREAVGRFLLAPGRLNRS